MRLFNLPIRFLHKLSVSSMLLLVGCGVVPVSEESRLNDELNQQNKISVCYDYSCKSESQIDLTGVEWQQINQLFQQIIQTPQAERQTIAKAVALMEQLSGKVIGTYNDKARNAGVGERGQMDCIDESRNTAAYIRLFEKKGWLKWHQIQGRVMRSHFFFDIHWTAVIKEKQSHQLYAVDSWFRANGKEPIILKLKDWKAKKEKP